MCSVGKLARLAAVRDSARRHTQASPTAVRRLGSLGEVSSIRPTRGRTPCACHLSAAGAWVMSILGLF